MTKISKLANATIENLRLSGIRFNIVTPVDRKVELHFEYELLGRTHVDFVAEVGDLGTVTEWGKTFAGESRDTGFCFTADGERIAA